MSSVNVVDVLPDLWQGSGPMPAKSMNYLRAMMRFLNSGLGRFRTIAFLEGLSLVLLLFVAMPVKYGLGEPLLVRYIGMAHGLLFILYVLMAVQQHSEQGWRLWPTTFMVMMACLIPFGTFYIDHRYLSPLHRKA